MAKVKNLDFKRRRKSLTNYKKRLAYVKSGLDRVVIRRSNRGLLGQIVRYSEKGDTILAMAVSNELKAYGWLPRGNRATAYLTGMLLARKASKKGIGSDELVLDIGLSRPTKNSAPFVFAKGCVDGGMKLKAQLEIQESVYNCKASAVYASKLKGESEENYSRQYSDYLKAKADPSSLDKLFEQAKEKISKA
jgi:large subunit ribosomal protein L18